MHLAHVHSGYGGYVLPFVVAGSLASPLAVARGYQPALSVAVGLSVLGALVALALRRARAPLGPDVPVSPWRDLTSVVRSDRSLPHTGLARYMLGGWDTRRGMPVRVPGSRLRGP